MMCVYMLLGRWPGYIPPLPGMCTCVKVMACRLGPRRDRTAGTGFANPEPQLENATTRLRPGAALSLCAIGRCSDARPEQNRACR